MVTVVASDVVSLKHCARRLWYEHNPPEGMEDVALDPFDQLIIEKGIEHERKTLEEQFIGREVVRANSVEHTQELMASGADVIYQGQLFDEVNELFGRPDFILRLEDRSYQAADAKSALSIKDEIGIQIAFYRRLLGSRNPALVFLGDGSTQFIESEFDAKLNKYITETRMVLGHGRPQVWYGETKCTSCPYYEACHPEFTEAEDLSLLYGVDSRSIPRLAEQGLDTISLLAAADPAQINEVPYLKGDNVARAVLQAGAWLSGETVKRNEIEMPEGTWVHFDIESNQFTSDGHQHVYLWGFLTPPYEVENFEYVWTDNEEDERVGWTAFLEKVETYRAQWPDVKLVHFHHFERTQIRKCAERFDMEEDDTVVRLLDEEEGPLYDIQKAVLNNFVLPLPGYSLKKICKHPDLVNFQWELEESGSQWSVVQYNKFLNCTDSDKRNALKEAILTYNRDDVRATRALETWLRSL